MVSLRDYLCNTALVSAVNYTKANERNEKLRVSKNAVLFSGLNQARTRQIYGTVMS
jgi:hypothetical protein